MKMKIAFASDDEKVFEKDIRTIEDLVELQTLYQAPIIFDVKGYFDVNSEEYLPSLTIYDDYIEQHLAPGAPFARAEKILNYF